MCNLGSYIILVFCNNFNYLIMVIYMQQTVNYIASIKPDYFENIKVDMKQVNNENYYIIN